MTVRVLYRPPVTDPDTAAIAERIRHDIEAMATPKERHTAAHDALTWAALRAAAAAAASPPEDYGMDNWGRSLPRPAPVVASSRGWYGK